MFTRRSALKVIPAASILAVDGGTPIRSTPLRPRLFGPLYYDDAEWTLLAEVFKTRSPFRFWGSSSEPPNKVASLEREFAAWAGVKYALAVNSGTSALETALAALQIGPGDEVIMPAWTWHSCWHAVVRHGALPVTAEIDSAFNLDPADVERRITPRTKVLMAVHLQGAPANLKALIPIARKHNLKILEDCSQAVGARYNGKPVGAHGDIAAASLQVNKTISAGEGGLVYTSDPTLFERAVRFHDVGGIRNPHQDWIGGAKLEALPGSNFRMNEFTGAVLVAQVRKLDRIVSDVHANWQRVIDGIKDLPGINFRTRHDTAGEIGVCVFIEFSSKDKRERFINAIKAENIPAGGPAGSVVLPVQGYAEKKMAIHPDWPSFNSERGRAIQYGAASCPKTLDILSRFGGVPLDPKYTESDTRDIIAAIRKVYPKVSA